MVPVSAEIASFLRDSYLMSVGFEFATLNKVFDAFPEDKLFSYKPHDVSMSAAELFWHIAGVEQMFLWGVIHKEFRMTPPEDRPEMPTDAASLKAAINGMHDDILPRLKPLDGEHLATKVDFMGMGAMPAVTYLEWDLNHLVHHRGQLTVYLRNIGAKVPAIYGMSADENPMAAGK